MSGFPVIKTAIPVRRYRLGEYDVTVLGDVESGDGVDYRYILAFVPPGQGQPSLYVCCEKNRRTAAGAGSHRIRVVNSVMSDVLGSSDDWRDLDRFSEEGLSIGASMLSIADEQPTRTL